MCKGPEARRSLVCARSLVGADPESMWAALMQNTSGDEAGRARPRRTSWGQLKDLGLYLNSDKVGNV